MSADDNKLDELELDEDMLEDMDIGEDENLFWSLEIPSNGTIEIEAPAIPTYIIHVTKACFGPTVSKNSRSVVMCNASPDPENPQFVPICALKEGVCENVNLDLVYNETCEFKVEGTKPSKVFLTGHLQPGDSLLGSLDDISPNEYGFDADELDDIDVEGLPEGSEDIEPSNENDNDNDNEDDIEQLEIDSQAQKKQKLNNNKAKVTSNGTQQEKQQERKRKSPKNKPVSVEKADQQAKKGKQNKQNKQKQNEKAVAAVTTTEAEGATPAAETKTETATPTASTTDNNNANNDKKNKKNKKKKKKMSGGLEYKDVREGTNKPIKKGDKVTVYYIGQRQSDSSIFDKTLSGNGFEFTVGKGEVIKGWDMGVCGMKGVGSKRKLWIPAKLAYGADGYGDIAGNTNLMFTVEVKKVN